MAVMDGLSEVLRKRAKVALGIWGLLTLCCAMFLALPYISIPNRAEGPGPESVEAIRLVLSVIAVFMGFATLFIRFFLFSEDRLRKLGEHLKGKFADDETRLSKFQQNWFTFNVISWGINESIASFGIVIHGLTGEPRNAVAFALAGIFLNLFMYPDFPGAAAKAGLWRRPVQ